MTTLSTHEKTVELLRMRRFADALASQEHFDRMWSPKTSRERRLSLIAQAAPVAAAALDARLLGDPRMLHEERWLVRLAIVAWRMATEGGDKVAKPWKVRRHLKLSRQGDVFCTFCGEMLAHGLEIRNWRDADFGPSTVHHTTLCALTRLAGMLTWCPRDVYRVPAEPDDDGAALANRCAVG